MTARRLHADSLALLVLVTLWLLFFWRLLTPIESDQASLKQGDFSGQFVAFAAYQYARLTAGEIPLWNPYNNGGLPFIADTQAAVFYPPRLLTIAISHHTGGWTYHSLELEMACHVLLYSLLMYAFVRRLLLNKPGAPVGGLIAAITAAYGGFLTGYPPLQLAVLEAGIWLPLAALGLLEATRSETLRPNWLLLTGLALGLSWLAGHPQTSFFLTYFLTAYFAYRIYLRRQRWLVFVGGAALWGGLAFLLAAVQLLPGLEYLPQTARIGFSYDAKGNGFPFRDLIQFALPGIISLFSPLYLGIVGLMLALLAIWRRVPGSLFWGGAALVALGLSFGANSAIFPALYNVLPGLRFFRGQERAAYLVANSLAVLAGIGAVHLLSWNKDQWPIATRNIQRTLLGLTGVFSAATAIVFNEWLNNRDLSETLNTVFFGVIIAVALLLIIRELLRAPGDIRYQALLIGLIIFELFTATMDSPATYDPIPPTAQVIMPPAYPSLLEIPRSDTDHPFRVDGYRALHDNYGSLYGLLDMRGISPLFLDGPYNLIGTDLINPTAWELFAVRYVYTDWKQLPVPSDVLDQGTDRYGEVRLHRLRDPRPFAHLVYAVAIADSDSFARALLSDSRFRPRQTIILEHDPALALPDTTPETGRAVVTRFYPESFTIAVETPTNAVLSLAHPDYPGWSAALDGQPVPILRAYGGLSAVAVPAGEHTVTLAYTPLSFTLGALLSLVTWITLGILVSVNFIQRRRHA